MREVSRICANTRPPARGDAFSSGWWGCRQELCYTPLQTSVQPVVAGVGRHCWPVSCTTHAAVPQGCCGNTAEDTRSSATAEGPRDALCRLKSCQPLQNCTKHRIWNGFQWAIRRMTLKVTQGHRKRRDTTLSIRDNISVLHHFRYSTYVGDCLWSWTDLQFRHDSWNYRLCTLSNLRVNISIR